MEIVFANFEDLLKAVQYLPAKRNRAKNKKKSTTKDK